MKKNSSIAHARYINREYSWLKFNQRVLNVAELPDTPLLERLRFLGIFESNLDEFYMVRVSGLIEQFEGGVQELSPDGLDPSQQLTLVSETASALRQEASNLWHSVLKPELKKHKINITTPDELAPGPKRTLEEYFLKSVFPLCTPLMLEPAITFPFISNRSLNLAIELMDGKERRLARIKIPPVVPRLVTVPGDPKSFIWLEDLIGSHLDYLFPGVQILGFHKFRVLRDADIEIRELEAADLITAIEQTLRLRRFGDPVLLEIGASLDPDWIDVIRRGLKLDDSDVIRVDGFIGFDGFHEIADLPRPELRYPRHSPKTRSGMDTASEIFEAVRKRDLLLHHPFESFGLVEKVVQSAVSDPNVVGLKQTLYRVGSESPIVESLLEAGEQGKQVAAVVELKARFDESNNLVWSRALERAGVHVTYGIPEMKVHCKLCLVIREEEDGLRTYVHIGTGNYNPTTARIYTDLGLLTCDEAIAHDVTELFNYLTGFSKQVEYRKLLVAPVNLRERIIDHIHQETSLAKSGKAGTIKFKLNSLVDPEVIDALYDASSNGVKIDIVARGICCLRPGVPGLSENIKVVSIVGRFLEHSRIYAFGNDGNPEVFIGSADMMRRNLDRRVEVLVPLQDMAQKRFLIDTVIAAYLSDTQQSWLLTSDGAYVKQTPKPGSAPISAQVLMIEQAISN